MTTPPGGYQLRTRPATSARAFPEASDRLRLYRDDGERLLAQPFRGITAGGMVAPGLFKVEKTGVPTRPIAEAAEAFLASLGPAEREAVQFPVETEAWRRWSNIHPWIMRHGVCLDALGPAQRERALALLRQSLSAQGFETARGVMKLNEAIREITGRDDEYGEWLYWLSLMGTPSDDAPWGWQIDGHHLIVNCFVLGDQVVMTPMFMGSEPVSVDTGRYAGTRVFETEERQGLTLVRALTEAQRARTVLGTELPTEVFTAAFRDNLELSYQGIRYGDLSDGQQGLLLALLETYVGRIRPGHAALRMEEVSRHLGDTHFAWIGGVDPESVFYYRIHSPVALIEFDHQRGIALANDEPSRTHIHTVIRTPNGNDYGRDLLRQHHERFDHRHAGHTH